MRYIYVYISLRRNSLPPLLASIVQEECATARSALETAPESADSVTSTTTPTGAAVSKKGSRKKKRGGKKKADADATGAGAGTGVTEEVSRAGADPSNGKVVQVQAARAQKTEREIR